MKYNRTLYITLILFIFSYTLFSQENEKEEHNDNCDSSDSFFYRYCVDENSLSTIDEEVLSDHPLGMDIAKKFYYFKDTYTFIEAATPTSPGEKTIVYKPNIYNSLLKLNRYYKKQVKQGLLTKEEAGKRLNRYLDIAISIFIENTETFESKLKKAKSPDEISQVFSLVVLE